MQRRGFLGMAAATLLVFSAGVVANVQGAPGGGGQGGGRRGGGMGRGGGGGLQLLRIPEVQRELKMTPEQIAKIEPAQAALRQSLQGQGGGNPGQASREERQAMMARMRDAQTKAVNGILDATQQKRFRQLELQQQGANALTRKDVADELKLTELQQKDIVEVQRRAREDMQSAMAGVDFQNMSPEERQAMGAKMQAAQKATDEKITALLTDAQKAQWKEMQGAPFTFPANARGGGFGGGRRGGGGAGRSTL